LMIRRADGGLSPCARPLAYPDHSGVTSPGEKDRLLKEEGPVHGAPGHNLLIKAPNWLGDLVLFTPALRALRTSFPDSGLCVVGNSATRDIVALSGIEVEYVYFDRHGARPAPEAEAPSGGSSAANGTAPSPENGWMGRSRTVGALRARPWDAGITFAEGFSSALLLRLAGARRVFGYRGDGRRLLLSTALPRERIGRRPHLVTEYLELARAAGAVPGQRTPSFEMPEETLRAGRKILEDFRLLSGMPIVGLCPGSEYGPSKRWPADRFSETGSRLADAGAKIAVFGAPSERTLAEEVARRIEGAESLAGRTSVIGLGACLASCDAVVANDSGAAHLAAAVGTPVVALFTSSDPEWTRPQGAEVRVMRADVDCAPCFNRECDLGYPCLTGISPGQVSETVLFLVKRGLRKPHGNHRASGRPGHG